MKKIISTLLILSLLFGSIIVSFSNTSNTRFKDNSSISDYARAAVNWSVANGIINGDGENNFNPRQEMPERHWVAILTRYIHANIPEAKTGEHWSVPNYNISIEYKLPFKGNTNTSLRTGAINRGDVARTIAAAYGFNLTLEQSVEFMYENEFSVGSDPNLMNYNTYGVNSNLTRQQAVVILHRINELVTRRGGVLYRGTLYPVQAGSITGLKNGGRTFNTPPDWTRFSNTSSSITDVNVLMRNNKPEVRVKASNILRYREVNWGGPTLLVFDLENTRFDIRDKSKLLANNTLRIDLGNEILERVTSSQFSSNPLTTRVVLTLNSVAEHRVYFDDINRELVITFDLNSIPPVNRGQEREPITSLGRLNAVSMDYIQNREMILLEGLGIDDINVFDQIGPKRLVIDIKNTEVAASLLNSSSISLNGRAARAIRVSQHRPESSIDNNEKIARVVIDLHEHINTKDFTIDVSKNNIVIYLEKVNQPFVYEEVNGSSSKLTLSANQISNYTTSYDDFINVLFVTVPKQHITLTPNMINYNNPFIQYINIYDMGSHYQLEIKLMSGVDNRLLTPLNSKDLVIQFNRQGTRYSNVLIVIDPGHGGDKPGAVSPILRIFESHLALDVSNRLNRLLLDAGFRTHMTRTTDVDVDNLERAMIANQLNANLFVSVHANAFTNRDINGIETHYYPSERFPEDPRDNKGVAQIFQAEMVRILQGNNRGIYPRENIIVLRETRMPAVLCEIGYLTNPIEEAKLATEEYRQKAAEAMFAAIVRYFNGLGY